METLIESNEWRAETAQLSDLEEIVALREEAAGWMVEHGIQQWQPGGMKAEHFREYVDRLGSMLTERSCLS